MTENVEQLQIIQALEVVRNKALAALLALANRAEQWKDLVITARTHNVPAQPTTFGKRLAMFGEDLLLAVRELDRVIDNYPVRGLKGPVGTQMDLLTLFGDDSAKVASLEGSILDHLGVGAALDTVGRSTLVASTSKSFRSLYVSLPAPPALRRHSASWRGTNSPVKALPRAKSAPQRCRIR